MDSRASLAALESSLVSGPASELARKLRPACAAPSALRNLVRHARHQAARVGEALQLGHLAETGAALGERGEREHRIGLELHSLGRRVYAGFILQEGNAHALLRTAGSRASSSHWR